MLDAGGLGRSHQIAARGLEELEDVVLVTSMTTLQPVIAAARPSPVIESIYYPGAPHGLTATHQDQVNADLLAFLRA